MRLSLSVLALIAVLSSVSILNGVNGDPISIEMDTTTGFLKKIQWNGLNLAYPGQTGMGTGLSYTSGNTVGKLPADVRSQPFTVDTSNGNNIVTRFFAFGSLTYSFRPIDENLYINVTISNNQTELTTKFLLYPLMLTVPGWRLANAGQKGATANTGSGPSCPRISSNYTSASLPNGYSISAASEVPGELLRVGWPNAFPNDQSDYWLLQLSHDEWNPVPEKGSKTIQISIRFRNSVSAGSSIHCPDVQAAFLEKFPYVVNWPDRRPIGQDIMASPATRGKGNPRGWSGINDKWDGWNMTAITADFRKIMMKRAADTVALLTQMNAQGTITWDISGGAFPTSNYDCDPRTLAEVAPEAEAVADDYFGYIRNAGFRVGMCIRPQNLTLYRFANGTLRGGENKVIPESDQETIYELLRAKVAYCVQRWNATLFYVDSNHAQQDWRLYYRLLAEFPGVLFVPEWEVLATYLAAAPYRDSKLNEYGPSGASIGYDPRVFGVIKVTTDKYKEATYNTTLFNSVKTGNVLMGHSWWSGGGVPLIAQAYAANPRPPVAINKTVSIFDRSATKIWLEATDPDNGCILECYYNCYTTNQLTITVTKNPTKGQITNEPGMPYLLTYTPNGAPAADTIEYSVSDGQATVAGKVTIAVAGAPVTTGRAIVTTGRATSAVVTTGKATSAAVTSGRATSAVVTTGRVTSAVISTGRATSAGMTTGKTGSAVVTTGRATSAVVTSGMAGSPVVTTGRAGSPVTSGSPVATTGIRVDSEATTGNPPEKPEEGATTAAKTGGSTQSQAGVDEVSASCILSANYLLYVVFAAFGAIAL